MKIKLLLFLIVCLELFAVFQWVNCRDFVGEFHYSQINLDLQLTGAIHNDREIPIWLVRVFHNKVVGAFFAVFDSYSKFWGALFLTSFLSFAGIVGLGAQFYSFFTNKKRFAVWIAFLALLVSPLVEIFLFNYLPFAVRLTLIAFPFVAWSMLGFKFLLEKKKVNSKIVDLLIVVSLWYLLAFHPLATFCVLK